MFELIDQTASGVRLGDGSVTLTVDFLTPEMLRIRKHTGDEPVRHLIRYEFLRDDWPGEQIEIEQAGSDTLLRGSKLTVSISNETGALRVLDASGAELLAEAEPARAAPHTRTSFTLPPDRAFFGMGDQNRDHLNHRGQKADLWVRNVTGYIPIPLIVTDDGFGLVINTTRRVKVDLGVDAADRFGFEVDDDSLDYYVLYGPTPAEILERYTALSGRPPMPPRWAMGLWFVCRTQANSREFVDDCYAFRREGIPCDAIGLEPGWMEVFYDYSTTKDWSKERFPVPSYARYGESMFIPAARRMGFKPGLWLCIDYDLSYEEERRLGRGVQEDDFRAEFAEGAEVDEHFNAARRMDPITRPDEPWFEHLKDFVNQGIDWFKQDGSNQVLDHPDRLYGNGMHDDEMHNLYPLLYNRQMYEGFREHTGRRPWVFTCAGWAGMQAHCSTWTGDTGGGAGPAAACMNLSMSGHGMTGCDMEVYTKQGIHFGFLMPWAQVNSWNYFRHPWLLGDELFPVFYSYAKLRYRLLPYLYSCAHQAHQTGLPIMRAMPLAYPDDRETFELLSQYMLGPDLLVGVFTDRLYLPEGDWYDFWSNEVISGGRWIDPEAPEDRGGPLFVRAGAIIPGGPDIDYVGQRPDDELTFHVYPGPASRFDLYEDDGLTHEFEQGACRITRLSQETAGGVTSVVVDAAEGTFAGAVTARRLSFLIPLLAPPSAVALNGESVPEDADKGAFWAWDDELLTLYVDLGWVDVTERVELSIPRSG